MRKVGTVLAHVRLLIAAIEGNEMTSTNCRFLRPWKVSTKQLSSLYRQPFCSIFITRKSRTIKQHFKRDYIMSFSAWPNISCFLARLSPPLDKLPTYLPRDCSEGIVIRIRDGWIFT
ncbi:hypothetical protein F5Y15DRAFT_87763 [Xylariaceae sp. FL0016]|nr:hypothetical protein F5Y15DRAFT_87763 [Xylariaceae sp. FL0016]